MKRVILLSALLLGGCVHSLPKSTASQHHYVAKPIVKPAAKSVAPPAVVAPTPQPSPKQSFKRRWLRLFFRDRAAR